MTTQKPSKNEIAELIASEHHISQLFNRDWPEQLRIQCAMITAELELKTIDLYTK